MAVNDKSLLRLLLEEFVGAVAFAGRGDERRESSIVLPGGGVVKLFWIKLCPGPVALLLNELVVRVGNVVRFEVVVDILVLVGVEVTDCVGDEVDSDERLDMELEELNGLLIRLLRVLRARLLELLDEAAKLERELLLVLRLKLLLLDELPKLEREVALLDKELEPVLRVEVLREILLEDRRAEVFAELLCRDDLTADWRAARVEDCRVEDCKDLELLDLLELREADFALEAALFFWKLEASAQFNPIIASITPAAISQGKMPIFVLSTCHFMTCTPVCLMKYSGVNIRNFFTVSHRYFRLYCLQQVRVNNKKLRTFSLLRRMPARCRRYGGRPTGRWRYLGIWIGMGWWE